jgi:hypothetical protein
VNNGYIFVLPNSKKDMKNLTFTLEELALGHAKEMSKIAKENVTAQLYENDDLYVFGSELACLRIAYFYKAKETNVKYSENLKTFYVAIYSGK